MHSSKGMEFKNVFVVNINNGSIPHQNSDDVMEELRLFYVAITRTIENLVLLICIIQGQQYDTTITIYEVFGVMNDKKTKTGT